MERALGEAEAPEEDSGLANFYRSVPDEEQDSHLLYELATEGPSPAWSVLNEAAWVLMTQNKPKSQQRGAEVCLKKLDPIAREAFR